MLLIGLVTLIAGVFLVPTYFGFGALGAEVSARGTAVAKECRYTGPVAESNVPSKEYHLGFGWICRAEVRWNDGREQVVETSGSQLTDDDIGQRVRVEGRRIADGNRTSATRMEVYRANFEPRPWLGAVSILATCLVGVLLALFGLASSLGKGK